MARIVERGAFTLNETAAILGVSRDKVACWVRSGELAAFDAATKLGGRSHYRVTKDAIEQFKLKRAVVPDTPLSRRRRSVCPLNSQPWVKQFV